MKENIIQTKSFSFSLKIIDLYNYLASEKREYILSKQLLRSATSIGANISEAIHATSNADFVNKLSISLKEANETDYWLKLLTAKNYIDTALSKDLQKDCTEILKLLTSIVKTCNKKTNAQ